MGGWGEVYPSLCGMFGICLTLQSPLEFVIKTLFLTQLCGWPLLWCVMTVMIFAALINLPVLVWHLATRSCFYKYGVQGEGGT